MRGEIPHLWIRLHSELMWQEPKENHGCSADPREQPIIWTTAAVMIGSGVRSPWRVTSHRSRDFNYTCVITRYKMSSRFEANRSQRLKIAVSTDVRSRRSCSSDDGRWQQTSVKSCSILLPPARCLVTLTVQCHAREFVSCQHNTQYSRLDHKLVDGGGGSQNCSWIRVSFFYIREHRNILEWSLIAERKVTIYYYLDICLWKNRKLKFPKRNQNPHCL